MKKVISALTAAAMCASMSASVMSVFAVDAAKAEIYLKAASASAGTLSEDGSTLTFASAADAAGAKINVQAFIKADATEPNLQQVITAFSTSSKSIKLGGGVSLNQPVGDAKDYDINGTTVNTNLFVNCFAQANKRGKLTNPSDQTLWGHSDEFTFDYDGPDIYNYIWQSAKGAAFTNGNSESYPFTQFEATLASDIKDGTYTIEIPETWENLNKKNPTTNGAIMDIGDGEVKVGKTTPLTIVVGDAGAQTETPAAETPAAETPAAETPAAETPAAETPAAETPEKTTDKQEQGGTTSMDDKKNSKDWTWYADEVVYDPAEDPDRLGVEYKIYVTKDPGTYGFQFTPKIDGKSLKDAGFEFEVEQADGGYAFDTFTYNEEDGATGGSNATKENKTVSDGTAVVTFYIVPPADAKPGTEYKFTIEDLIVGDFAEKKYNPATIGGTIKIKGESDPVEQSETPTSAQQETPAASTDWRWVAEDVTYNPAEDTEKMGVALNISVENDPGTYGFQFTPKIDGKGLDVAGWTFEVEQADGGYAFDTFTYNEADGATGGSNATKENKKVANGQSVVTFYLVPPEGIAPGKYSFDIEELIVGDFAEKKYNPATKSGSITIVGDTPSETPTSAQQETPTSAQQETPTSAQQETPSASTDKPLYGDVNVDGKVELVDVVKLNRYLCNIDKELKGVAVINANCYRAKNESDADTTVADLSGEDSVEILKYLIKLVKELPTKAG
ncbi:MAG: hypothetical protein K6F80_03520 [Oscillospiraceae bacterium]|nr:hypothetical protein [Oscillospiraceae bacterium]